MTVTRRRILQTGSAGVVFATAPSILRAQPKTLFVNTYGGVLEQSWAKAFFTPFTAQTGVQVKTIAPVSFAKLRAAVQAKNYEFDVTAFGEIEFAEAIHDGLLEKVDLSIVHKDKVPPGVVVDYGAGNYSLGTNIAYRKDKFPNGGPQNWKDFWDVKKFPGTRCFYDRSFTCLAFALLADGVPMDKLYPMDLDRAFKKMNEIKPHVKVWWTQGNQSQQLIRDGEVDMIAMWNARAQLMIDNGEPLHMVWNETHLEGGCVYVLKGTPRAKYAFQYMDFCAQAKPQAEFCNRLNYGSPNPEALKYMSKEAIAKSPTSPEHIEQGYFADLEWLQPRVAALKERFAQWLAS